uniref:xanthine dehydrogenase subunit XdhB n=1 Tax=Ndongobacter massiliensis TaxID=1871025 RepID=UPI0009315448|nr:xanthine dehydrogenase subunit XdhB [Ndongobacter massiliensis]
MFDYERVYESRSIPEALEILSEKGPVVIINGGTDVLIRARENKYRGCSLLNIANIEELRGVFLNDNKDIVIKAGTTFTEIENNQIVREKLRFLADASGQVGSPQVRNVATIGGNLCNGAVSADSAPSLFVSNAKLVLEKKSGKRIVPIEEFYLGPGKTVLEQDELLTEIIIKQEDYEEYFGVYKKFGKRRAMEIATLSCAVSLALEDSGKKIRDFKIAFGVAAPTPVRCYKTEEKVNHSIIQPQLFEEIKNSVLDELKPRDSWRASKELRIQIIREFSVRATQEAITKGREVQCSK